jgi:transposase
MGDFSDFERGQVIGARLEGASVTKTDTLLGVSRATVCEVMSAAYTNHGKRISAKRNSGRKSKLTEINRRTLRRMVRKITEDKTSELNIHLEDLVSTKSSIHGRAATAKLTITESNAQIRKRWCHDHRTWIPNNCKRSRDRVR